MIYDVNFYIPLCDYDIQVTMSMPLNLNFQPNLGQIFYFGLDEYVVTKMSYNINDEKNHLYLKWNDYGSGFDSQESAQIYMIHRIMGFRKFNSKASLFRCSGIEDDLFERLGLSTEFVDI
jgi:hypothetical protein